MTHLPFKWTIGLIILLILAFRSPVHAQDSMSDSLYWSQDSVLDARIDTLGREVVLSEIRNALKRAISYCNDRNVFLPADSVDAWIKWMRWAVILEDTRSIAHIESLLQLAQQGDHGNWQFHFVYMTMWASFEAHTKDLTFSQKTQLILEHLNQESLIANVFYEERMLDLGTRGIPIILDWSTHNLFPQMDALDREKLSEEDMIFPRLYDRFVMVFSNMINSENQTMIKALLAENEPHVRRFAKDVLEAAGL